MTASRTTTRVATLATCLLAAAAHTSTGCGKRHKMIQNKGSDTIVNLAQALAEEYHKVNPKVSIAVSGGGSGVGIAALENGQVDIANASREMKAEEAELAKKRTELEAASLADQVRIDVRNKWLAARTSFDSLAAAKVGQDAAEEALRLQVIAHEVQVIDDFRQRRGAMAGERDEVALLVHAAARDLDARFLQRSL